MNKGVFILPHEQFRFNKIGNGFKYKKSLTYSSPYIKQEKVKLTNDDVSTNTNTNTNDSDNTNTNIVKKKKDKDPALLKTAHELSFKLGKGFKVF